MRSALARRLVIAAAALLVLLGVAAGTAWWLATRQATLEWLIAEAVRRSNGALIVEGVSGSLLGPIGLRRVVYETESVRATLEDVRLDASPRDLARGSFNIALLEARALRVEIKSSDKRAEPPVSLALPVRVHIARASILQADLAGYALRDVVLAYDGDASGQALRGFSADSDFGRISADLGIAAAAPFGLAGQAQLAGRELAAAAKFSGSLLRLEIAAGATMKQARASGSARIAAFEPVWLEQLALHASGVDLAAFERNWPSTLLEIDATGSGVAGGLAGGRLVVRNLRPGMLGEGRIPVGALRGDYVLRDDRLDLSKAYADLGAAGALSGSARIGRHVGRADVTVSALNLRALHAALRTTRLNGTASAEFSAANQRLRAQVSERGISFALDATRHGDTVVLSELQAVAGGGEMRGRGQFSLAQPRRYSAELKLTRVDPSRFGDFPPAVLNGDLKLAGALAPDWYAEAELALVDSRLRGARLGGDAKGIVSSRGARDLKIALTAGANVLRAEGSLGQPRDALTFTLAAKRLADLDPGISGALSAEGRVGGEIDNLTVDADISGNSLRWKEGPLIAALRARVNGTAQRHTVSAQMQGERYDMTARFEGGWSAQSGWAGTLAAFENKGAWPAALAAPMPLTYARERLSAGPAELRVAGGRFALATFNWHNGSIETRGEVAQLPVAPLLELAGAPASRTDLRVGGNWSLAATPRLNGTLTLARQSGDIVTPGDTPLPLRLERLRLEARIVNDAVDATLDVAGLWLNGAVKAHAAALTPDAAIKLDGKLEAGSLRLLEPLIGTRAVLSGRAAATFGATGTLRAPNFTGVLAASELSLEAPQYGVRLREGTLRAELDDRALNLRQFRIRAGDGYLTASGVMSRGVDGGAKLEWSAQDFQVLDLPDMRLRVAGAGTMGLEAKKLSLRGALTAQQGFFRFDRQGAPRLASDVVVIGKPRAQPATGFRARFESQLVDVDVTIDVGNQVHLIGAGIDTDLSGKLRVVTTKQGILQAYGTLVSSRGIYFAFGQQLAIQRGRLVFDGPIDNPALDIVAKRRSIQVEVGVEITGTVRVPRVQLVSEPPLPDNEKLAWLTLGHGLQDATGADIALLQAAASALVRDGSSLPLTQRLATKLGLDDISLRGGGEAGSQVAAVGKRLSDRLYIEYQQGLEAASTVVRLSYVLTRAISLRLEAGATSSIGVFFNRSYP